MLEVRDAGLQKVDWNRLIIINWRDEKQPFEVREIHGRTLAFIAYGMWFTAAMPWRLAMLFRPIALI